MKWFWKAYYKLKFGKEYSARMKRAISVCSYIDEASVGDISSRYNYQGEQIRGWHRKRPSFASSPLHPLETYYKNK